MIVVERYHVPSSQTWPGSRGAAAGNVHLHVTEAVTLGRISRAAGECLCSKRRATYARPLDAGERDTVTRCERCYAVAETHGLEVAA